MAWDEAAAHESRSEEPNHLQQLPCRILPSLLFDLQGRGLRRLIGWHGFATIGARTFDAATAKERSR
jgi:hypothetical protein